MTQASRSLLIVIGSSVVSPVAPKEIPDRGLRQGKCLVKVEWCRAGTTCSRLTSAIQLFQQFVAFPRAHDKKRKPEEAKKTGKERGRKGERKAEVNGYQSFMSRMSQSQATNSNRTYHILCDGLISCETKFSTSTPTALMVSSNSSSSP